MQTERQQRSYGNSSIAPVARVVRVVRVVLVAERISSDGNDSSDHMETIRSLLSFASFVSLKNLPATGTTGTIIWKPGFTLRSKRARVEEDFCYDLCRVLAFEFRILSLEVATDRLITLSPSNRYHPPILLAHCCACAAI